MVNVDNTLIEVPIVLRDRIAAMRQHPRQPYYEVIEEALDFFDDASPARRGTSNEEERRRGEGNQT